jgi:transcriptional regulator with XRE-family HTH domain
MSRPLLAKKTHVSRNTLMAIEQGRVADPGIFTVASLIGVLGVSLDTLAQLASAGPGTPKKETRMTSGIVSVGYEGREIAEFVDDLCNRGVRTLVDVRLTPISRRPGFSKTRLKKALESGGIQYLHYRELGNPKENRAAFHGRAVEQGRSRFRALLSVPEAQVALGALGQRARQEVVAVLCFEKEHDACHRKVVIDAVTEAGHMSVVTA